MKTSISPKQFCEKLSIKNIPDADSKRIQQWLDSITIEKNETGSITPDHFKIKQINFNYFDKDQSLDIIKNLSMAYRYLFTNAYGEFIFFPSEGRKFSLQELLDVDPNTMFSIDTIYSFPIASFRRKSSLDKSIYEYPMFCHDPEVTYQNIKQKLEQRGHAAVIHDEKNDNIVGFSFGYRSILIEAWHLEEWVHPFVYSRFDQFLNKIKKSNIGLSKIIHDRYFNNFDNFLLKFNALIQNNLDTYSIANPEKEFGPNDWVYVYNAIATHPKIRHMSKPAELARSCLSMVDENTIKNLLMLGEAEFQSNAYTFFQTCGGKDIYGVLNQSSDCPQTGDNILMVCSFSKGLEVISLTHREFMKRYLIFHRNNKRP